jgi:ATP-dependent exoDNAse (exonuclease V) beta subunit
MLQLVELAYRWDIRATLRPRDFVKFVEHEAVEAPSDSRVRVMTVHKAKGLEFDAVVLPELDLRLTRGRGLYHAVLPLRDRETGRVLRIFPSLGRELRPLFPEIDAAGQQDRERELQDALGVAYVAITRARHALHLFTEGDRPESTRKVPFTFSGLVRGALGLHEVTAAEGDTLFESGTSHWGAVPPSIEGDGEVPEPPPTPLERPAAAAQEKRTRFLPHRTPSTLKEEGRQAIRNILSMTGGRARRVGSIMHDWLETLDWIDEWNPDLTTLHEIGAETVHGLSIEEAGDLARTLGRWLGAEEIRGRLQKRAYPEGSQVLNEEPFALRLDDAVFQGRIDRLVLVRDGGNLVGAEVLDFKTDVIDPGDEEGLHRAVKSYQGQMRVYRKAVALLFDLPEEKVKSTLVFLALGRLISVAD